jgi:hypothetical protein
MRYQPAGRDVVWEKFDGDSIVLDLSCGKYFSFSDSSNILWEALSQGTDTDSLIRACSGMKWASTFPDFVKELVDNRLIVAAEGQGTEISPELKERLAAATECPSLSVFDDLADLFVADPIHDVEAEQGWPVKKQA